MKLDGRTLFTCRFSSDLIKIVDFVFKFQKSSFLCKFFHVVLGIFRQIPGFWWDCMVFPIARNHEAPAVILRADAPRSTCADSGALITARSMRFLSESNSDSCRSGGNFVTRPKPWSTVTAGRLSEIVLFSLPADFRPHQVRYLEISDGRK